MHTQKGQNLRKIVQGEANFFSGTRKEGTSCLRRLRFSNKFLQLTPVDIHNFFCAVSLLLLYIWYLKLFRGHKDRTIQEWCVFKLSSSDWPNVMVKQRSKSTEEQVWAFVKKKLIFFFVRAANFCKDWFSLKVSLMMFLGSNFMSHSKARLTQGKFSNPIHHYLGARRKLMHLLTVLTK